MGSSKSVHSLVPEGRSSHVAVPVQPVKCDAQVSTNDAEYDRYLYVRIFAPDGLHTELPFRCIAMIGDQWVSTNPLYAAVEVFVQLCFKDTCLIYSFVLNVHLPSFVFIDWSSSAVPLSARAQKFTVKHFILL